MGYFCRRLYPAEHAPIAGRMLSAEIPWHRMTEHLDTGRVQVDGEVVADSELSAPRQSAALMLNIP
ncbi:hypothetical protein Psed_6084 [Pseudonocardia dioxanivorans CB1190]|uniref:Uncharacterized protein n=1 Tax=Pseudonocardia dioxanivorans (strain ATCC 55486 / DSM 44775 / JCM 13855 / CB1190) TaxID=675635 RepID=F4CLQ7_PSEUX|nr:hypothetical protein Psed_6084 [Pseudonocardia dioxanivorans CB1190]